MPGVLHDSPEMPQTTYAPNGARLVSLTGEALPLEGHHPHGQAVGGIARITATPALHQPVSDSAGTHLRLSASGRRRRRRVRDPSRQSADQGAHRAARRRADTVQAARLEGRMAALVEQERPNLFTQRLGNIPASTDVTVELTIDHPVAWLAGSGWEWRFPTVVAPRYLGTTAPSQTPTP